MKILIDIGHPAHVHLFKNSIRLMKNKGHQIKVTARDKDVAVDLLKAYDIQHQIVGNKHFNVSLLSEWLYRETKILNISKKFNPDLFLGTLNPVISHAGKIFNKPSIIFTDYEPTSIKYPVGHYMTSPFVDTFLVPKSVSYNYGENGLKLDTFKELAYLHPNHFEPDLAPFENIKVKKEEKYVILRFITWGAHHDVDRSGFDVEEKKKLIERLEEHAKVFISSEEPLPKELEEYELQIRPENLHDILFHANLLVCDSQTMATEGAVLGTPSIRCNSFVGKSDFGNFIELEDRYGLLFNYREPSDAIEKASQLIQKPNLDKKWKKRKERLFEDKIDLTAFMVWFLENYPESFRKMKENENIQYRFK